jgi:hypothetical protein
LSGRADEKASDGLIERSIRTTGRKPGTGRQPGNRQANGGTTENVRDLAER